MQKIFLIILSFFISHFIFGQEIKRVKVTEVSKLFDESKTPLIINFWATWCKPCMEEIPYFLEEIKNNRKDSLTIILVSLDFKEVFPAGIASVAKKRKFNALISSLTPPCSLPKTSSMLLVKSMLCKFTASLLR